MMMAASQGTMFPKLTQMAQVVTALLLRETKTRFGRNKLGYFWALAEPMAYVAIFVIIRSQIASLTAFGENLILFILSGLLIFRVFINIASRGLSALSSNKALMAYPPVKPFDVIVARILLESLTMLVVLVLFFAFLAFTAGNKVVYDFVAFASAISATLFLSLAFGTFNAVFSILLPSWAVVWRLTRLPTFILSGIFYVPKSLPPLAQDILWWNPVVHCVEWLRTAVYITYDPLLSKVYVLSLAAVLLTVGLSLERIYRYKILST